MNARSRVQARARAQTDSPMANALRAMQAYEYEYKPGFAEEEGQEPGEKNVGPMAQEMAADPVAGTAVVEDPETGLLSIDQAKALKLTMGGLAELQRQIDDLRRQKR